MTDSFSQYMLAQSRKETAYAQYNAASHYLEICQIKERLAEIQSQHEPIASLLNQSLSERERLCATAFYVVIGRMPPQR